jgi:hypothetical protein
MDFIQRPGSQLPWHISHPPFRVPYWLDAFDRFKTIVGKKLQAFLASTIVNAKELAKNASFVLLKRYHLS